MRFSDKSCQINEMQLIVRVNVYCMHDHSTTWRRDTIVDLYA